MTDADPQDPNSALTNEDQADLSTATNTAEPSDANTTATSSAVQPDLHATLTDPELQNHGDAIPDPNQQDPFRADADAYREYLSAGRPAPLPSPLTVWMQRIQTFMANPTRLYASAAVGLGLLFGLVFAAISWNSGSADGRYDLGLVTSSETGLRGHLFTKWDKKLEYRLSLEPSDPDQQAGFAHSVANPPHPLSIAIQLKDGQGFILCSKEIVLKYDPRKAAAVAMPAPDTQAGETNAAGSQPAQTVDFARLDAEEVQREQGKDIFQNETGTDGRIAAINAQGDISCSKKAYEDTAYWSFTPNFPTVAEQQTLLKRPELAQADATPSSPQASAARRKKMALKAAVKPLFFSIEGDDSVVDFDAYRGVIETSTGKTFFFDKSGGDISDLRWQDYPVSIHYRCDQSSNCTLMHSGMGTVRARLRR